MPDNTENKDVNLEIKNSDVIKQNLILVNDEQVVEENLILGEMFPYVLRYAPKVVNDNETMDAIYRCLQEEIAQLNIAIRTVIYNTFMVTLNYYGVIKWEKVLKLESNANLDITTRRNLILTKMRFKPPFTRQNLMINLAAVWGAGNYQFEIDYNNFQLVLDIHTNEPEVYLKFHQYVRDLVPANMYVIFSIQYTYMYLYRNKNYNQLSSFTYGEISKYSEAGGY